MAVSGGVANESEGQWIIDIASGELLGLDVQGENVRWSADDRYIGVSDKVFGGRPRIFDSATGKEVLRVQGTDSRHCMGEYWLDGRNEVALDADRAVQVPSGAIVSRSDSQHTGFDEGRYSEDGRRQLTFSGGHVTMLDSNRAVAEVQIAGGRWAASTGTGFVPFAADRQGIVSLANVDPANFCIRETGTALPFGIDAGPLSAID